MNNSVYTRNMDKLAKAGSGLFRNLERRALICQDEPWWGKSTSPWKLSIVHPPIPGHVGPDYWFDRAFDLSAIDIVHQNFGLSLNDLMSMDVGTFITFETKVHELLKKREQQMDPQLKKELQKK